MVKFGPSGNSNEFYENGLKNSEQAPKWLAEKGLTLYEYSFGRGANITDKKCELIGSEAEKYGVEVSVHAPYYINFANTDDEMIEKSIGYVLRSAEKLRLMKGERVIFHPAALGKLTRERAVELTKERLKLLAERIYAAGMDDLLFCVETMGKINQIGTLEEVAEFTAIDRIFIPTIDFGHLNARTLGNMNSEEQFEYAFQHMQSVIGEEKLRKTHIHFSKIEYSKGGEVKHLTFEDKVYGPEFLPLAPLLKKYAPDAHVISESDGTQSQDALAMKEMYESLVSVE